MAKELFLIFHGSVRNESHCLFLPEIRQSASIGFFYRKFRLVISFLRSRGFDVAIVGSGFWRIHLYVLRTRVLQFRRWVQFTLSIDMFDVIQKLFRLETFYGVVFNRVLHIYIYIYIYMYSSFWYNSLWFRSIKVVCASISRRDSTLRIYFTKELAEKVFER